MVKPFSVTDLTTPAEYAAVQERFPEELRRIIAPNLVETDEIILDLNQPLSVRFGGLRIDYPLVLDPVLFGRVDTEMQSGVTKGWRADGRIGIPGTLHRISRETNLQGASVMITVRIGRALIGVAEPLREVIQDAIDRGVGIAIIGPPFVGKTTLLRDIARIMAERLGRGLIIMDTSNEIGGDSDLAHWIIGKARRVIIGDPQLQGGKYARAIANAAPQALLGDELGYRNDIPIIVENAPRGVPITATLHGRDMVRVVKSQKLWPLLGIRDGRKLDPSTFAVAIEVLDRGHYRVHTDFDRTIEALLDNATPTEGLHEVRVA
ncbi:AAA ATPase [Deinococcus aerius]|uniref:AAA ATPase n=1 Tax=Deinococcus aerius TaxID=200253 RepID=A0A2I9DR22_9DEIO|nr:AAA family ATPase [Deinococcus aerius]GBF04747.1 AAA ATPase [Deinococcus aerius]